jgi:hypothetical protein
MSLQSTDLRDQAAKWLVYASAMTDAEAADDLRKLAAEYIAEAEELDRKDSPAQ